MSMCKKCVMPVSAKSYWPSAPLRIMLGVLFAIHGYPKLFGDPAAGGGVQAFATFLGNAHVFLPLASAWIVALLEFFGGILLVLGAFTPIVSTLLVVEFLVATWVKVSYIKAPFVGGYELDLLILACALTLAWWTGHESCEHGKAEHHS